MRQAPASLRPMLFQARQPRGMRFLRAERTDVEAGRMTASVSAGSSNFGSWVRATRALRGPERRLREGFVGPVMARLRRREIARLSRRQCADRRSARHIRRSPPFGTGPARYARRRRSPGRVADCTRRETIDGPRFRSIRCDRRASRPRRQTERRCVDGGIDQSLFARREIGRAHDGPPVVMRPVRASSVVALHGLVRGSTKISICPPQASPTAPGEFVG